MHSIIMENFPTQNYEDKLEFETYNEPVVTNANHQRDIGQSVNDQTPSQQQIQMHSQENNDTSTLQQQQQQQQAEQAHQVTQIQPNIQQGATLTPVRLPAILDGEFFVVTRVEDTNVTVRCLQCQKLLNGNLKSTGNFLSHIKVTYDLNY